MTAVNVQMEVDGGTSNGGFPTWRTPLVSAARRASTGLDTIVMSECFNATAQNTAAWRTGTTTFTAGFSGGYVVLNNGNVTTANAAQVYQSTRVFPLVGQSPLVFDISAQLTAVPTGTATVEAGLFLANPASTPFTATDGVFFRVNANGVVGVLSFNTTETTTAVLLPAAAIAVLLNINLNFRIIITQDFCEFWGADSTGQQSLLARLPTPAANGQPFSSCSAPVSLRIANGATAPSTAMQFKASNITVTQSDINTSKPWSHQMAMDSQMSYQGQNGNTMGSTALFSNSLAAGAGAVMTNTTAALGTGLGGQFDCLPTLAAGTDGIVCDFTNPANSVSITGRTLIITGMRVQGVVTTVLVGNATPVIYIYSIAYGHTATSLATAEGANAKAPRRVPLGIETFAAAAALGTEGSANGQYLPLNGGPIVVNPGEHIAICAKNVGVVTATGVITFIVTPVGYWE